MPPRTVNGETLDDLGARIAVAESRISAGETLASEREDRNKERFVAMKTAVDAALAASDRAVSKAEEATEKRFASVNEFRQALTDQTNTLLPRTEYTVQHQALIDRDTLLEKQISDMQAVLSKMAERGAGRHEGIGAVGTIVLGIVATLSALAAAGAFLVSVFRH